MAWVKGTSASGVFGAAAASLQVTAGQSLNIGDIVCLSVSYGTLSDVPSVCVIDDPAGKCGAFTQQGNIHIAANQETNFVAFALVTTAGIPTPRIRWNPTPGTTTSPNASMVVDPFTGSDSASAADGAGNGTVNSPAGAGTDNLVSGNWSTATDGDLIYSGVTDSGSGNDNMTKGSGFTDGVASAFIVVRSEFKTQTTHSATTNATFSSTVASNFLVAAMAITPAPGGGGGAVPQLTTLGAG